MERYDNIGITYDGTRRADPGILSDLADFLEVHDDGKYLDVGCGSGNYTVELAKLGGVWTGLDPSETMLGKARAKAFDVEWQKGCAELLPFSEDNFDGVVCSLAIHHFSDLPQAFKEIARVLKSHGKFVLFTQTPRQMESCWLWQYFPNMMRLSCDQTPSLNTIDAALTSAGLRVAQIKPFYVTPQLQDRFLYSGKQRPEMYLSEEMRSGISTFHLFCEDSELQQGLKNLEADIASGQIKNIQDKYISRAGDYMTIQVEQLET